jgi:hydroxymethylbilane synthase
LVRLGTRGSELALWQARHVHALLRERVGLEADLEIIRTEGDRQQKSLGEMEGVGFFTREIEEALLERRIDLAVHSHKDLPTDSPQGLLIAAVPERGPAEDCLLVGPRAWDERQPRLPLRPGASVGTGSARRRSQLLAQRPDLRVADLRGNVPTRIRRCADGDFDAILLARAGLERLGLDPAPLRVVVLPVEDFVPAPAQGALAVQVRLPAGGGPDADLAAAIGHLHHADTARRVEAERLLLASFAGGCNLPLGAHAWLAGGRLRLLAALGRQDGLARCLVEADAPAEAARLARIELTA